jgi:hypothetical protein
LQVTVAQKIANNKDILDKATGFIQEYTAASQDVVIDYLGKI